jgi:hypothetical protein
VVEVESRWSRAGRGSGGRPVAPAPVEIVHGSPTADWRALDRDVTDGTQPDRRSATAGRRGAAAPTPHPDEELSA